MCITIGQTVTHRYKEDRKTLSGLDYGLSPLTEDTYISNCDLETTRTA